MADDPKERDAPGQSPITPLAPYPPRMPTRTGRAPEFYGFVAFVSTSLGWVLFLLWALLPDEWIRWCGVSWYPSREWAILLPSYSIVLVLLTYFTYASLAIAATPSFSELRTITGYPSCFASFWYTSFLRLGVAWLDDLAYIPDPVEKRIVDHLMPDAHPGSYDLPIGLVNRMVYAKRTMS